MNKLSQSPNFKPFMKKLAVMAALLAVVGLIMKLLSMPGGTPLLVTGGGMLAVVTFMLATLFPYPYSVDDERYVGGSMPIWNFSMKITGWSLSILIMGLLFMLMHWPGGDKMSIFGGASLVISGIAWLFFLRLKNKSNNQ